MYEDTSEYESPSNAVTRSDSCDAARETMSSTSLTCCDIVQYSSEVSPWRTPGNGLRGGGGSLSELIISATLANMPIMSRQSSCVPEIVQESWPSPSHMSR